MLVLLSLLVSRQICLECHYPISTCVCANIETLTLAPQLIVMQHPSEVEHAKNSVRLLKLVIPDTQVYVGETAEDFADLRDELASSNRPVYLIYPNEQSQEVKQAKPNIDGIYILLDGTWRKAFRMLQLNPWLLALPSLHLDVEQASNYTIRKSSRADSLSTLEAAALVLASLDSTLDVSPLHRAFDAMIQHQLAAMPAHVRARYS